MRTLWSITVVVAMMHSALFVALLSWLFASGRIDRDRLDGMLATFNEPVAIEQARLNKEARDAERAAAEAAREGAIDQANLGADNRLVHLQKLDSLLDQKRERDRIELERMRSLLADERMRYEAERDALRQDREAFEAEVERRQQLVRDEQFQKMLATFEGLPAGEQKQLILEYIARNEETLALDILNNLPKRTAQNLLKQFEGDAEVGVAADLLRKLIDHGA